MAAWDVYLGKKLIDTVFFDDDCDKDYVTNSLINHDGYHHNIQVRKPRNTRPRRKR